MNKPTLFIPVPEDTSFGFWGTMANMKLGKLVLHKVYCECANAFVEIMVEEGYEKVRVEELTQEFFESVHGRYLADIACNCDTITEFKVQVRIDSHHVTKSWEKFCRAKFEGTKKFDSGNRNVK